MKNKTIEIDLKKLTDLIILASNLVDILEEFGCEDVENYRKQINEWTHQ